MAEITDKKKDAVSEAMSKIYDLAIDHAIEVVRQHYMASSGTGNVKVNMQIDSIVIKLKALKS